MVRIKRALLATGLVVVAGACLVGCGAGGTASGVEPALGGPMVLFKPCGDEGIRRLVVLDPKNREVWTATRLPNTADVTEMTIGPTLDGYQVADRRPGGALQRGTVYRVVADASDGNTWNGPTFDPANLRQGKVLVGNQQLDAQRWIADKPSCRGHSWTFVAGAALLAGLGAAAIMGLILGPLWLLRRAALRRAREREGDLPWLHDPPPDMGGLRRPSLPRPPWRRRPPRDPDEPR